MNEYKDSHASLMAFIRVEAEALSTTGHPFTALNLDAFANPTEWPAGNFLGVAEFQLQTDGQFVEVMTAIVVSTRNDMNLFLMGEVTNVILDKLVPGKHVSMIDADTGIPRGKLHVLGFTRVGAVQPTESQPARPIMVKFKADQSYRSA